MGRRSIQPEGLPARTRWRRVQRKQELQPFDHVEGKNSWCGPPVSWSFATVRGGCVDTHCDRRFANSCKFFGTTLTSGRSEFVMNDAEVGRAIATVDRFPGPLLSRQVSAAGRPSRTHVGGRATVQLP